jgi:hypothetical protein
LINEELSRSLREEENLAGAMKNCEAQICHGKHCKVNQVIRLHFLKGYRLKII